MSHQIIDPQANSKVSNIGRLLLELGKITPEDTDRILRKQKETGQKFGDVAKHLGLINDEDVQYVLSKQFEYTYLQSENVNYSRDLIAAYEPFSSQVEAFRALRSQLLFRWLNEGFKAFSIVSANSNEGCSYLAANLAIVFSQMGKKTLLVDGNMRTPRQHKIFNLKHTFGLSDILADRTAGSEVLTGLSDFPNLTVLGAGTVPPNPQELIGRSTFTQLIKYASSIFDVIIVDTPSLKSGSDAQMFSSILRGAVIVTRLNHTAVSDIQELKLQIEGSGATIIGAVLSDFEK